MNLTYTSNSHKFETVYFSLVFGTFTFSCFFNPALHGFIVYKKFLHITTVLYKGYLSVLSYCSYITYEQYMTNYRKVGHIIQVKLININ